MKGLTPLPRVACVERSSVRDDFSIGKSSASPFVACSITAVWVGIALGTPCAVSVVKSLWASVQGNPVFMRRVNGWLTIFWIGMIPVSIALGLLSSVAYVSALSLWALVSGHWSAWQAARVEVAQQTEVERAEKNPVEDKVVEKIIAETEIERTPIRTDAASESSGDSGIDEVLERLRRIETVLQSREVV